MDNRDFFEMMTGPIVERLPELPTDVCDHEDERIVEEYTEVPSFPPLTTTVISYYYENCGQSATLDDKMEEYDHDR